MNAHRRLHAWNRCIELGDAVIELTERLPRTQRFALTMQLERGAMSPASNVAEGYARRGPAELRRFIGYALGSLAELDSLLELARRKRYVRR